MKNTADVIVVGSGAAAMTSALYAHQNGASVIVLESEATLGGTTALSGAGIWIPNNFRTKEAYNAGPSPVVDPFPYPYPIPFPSYLPRRDLVLQGLVPGEDFIQSTPENPDPKLNALRYMCRSSAPDYYDPYRAFNGLPPHLYKLYERMYDDGDRIIRETTDCYGVNAKSDDYLFDWILSPYYLAPNLLLTIPFAPIPPIPLIPNYPGLAFGDGTYLEQDYSDWLDGSAPGRRLQWYDKNEKKQLYGIDFVTRIADYITSRNERSRVLTNRRVIDLIDDNTLDVIDPTTGQKYRYRANKGIVFGCGGFARNEDLLLQHLKGRIFGSCSGSGSKGDFVKIAMERGIRTHGLQNAYFHEIDYKSPYWVTWFLNAASSITLNKYGVRVYNEGAKYNERGKVHFDWDAGKLEYPNQYLFYIYDGQVLEQEGKGSMQLNDFIHGETLGDLYDALLLNLPHGILTDKDEWVKQAEITVANYNSYCRTGVDPEFHREKSESSKHWYAFGKMMGGVAGQDFNLVGNPNLWMRSNTPGTAPTSPAEWYGPNFVLQPLQPDQPESSAFRKGYFARILVPSIMDTHGGPLQNRDCRAVGTKGIYAVGNAGGGAIRSAYWGPGGTIGWCVVSGAIAGAAAARNNMDNENHKYGKSIVILSPNSGQISKNPVRITMSVNPKLKRNARVFYKLDADLHEYVERCECIAKKKGWVENKCDSRFTDLVVVFKETGWHNVAIQITDEAGRSLGAGYANMTDVRVEENHLVRIQDTFESALEVTSNDIVRFEFLTGGHNLVHTLTNGRPANPVLLDTRTSPDVVPKDETMMAGFAVDFKPPTNAISSRSTKYTFTSLKHNHSIELTVLSVNVGC